MFLTEVSEMFTHTRFEKNLLCLLFFFFAFTGMHYCTCMALGVVYHFNIIISIVFPALVVIYTDHGPDSHFRLAF